MINQRERLCISSCLTFLCLAGNASLAQAEDENTVMPTASEQRSWADDITLGVFVDAYGGLRSDNNEGRPAALAAAGAGYSEYPHQAYVLGDGFGLAFAGADLAYAGEQFGATMSLRFGPGAVRFYGADNGPLGIDNITQAYVTWKPVEGLTLDFGQFYTPYGAEVAESWRNVNYSRGALYYAMQPFWHVGMRANYVVNDKLQVNGLVVNGVNSAFENNKSPSLGLQAVVTPFDGFSLLAGYLGALHPRDGGEATSNFDHFLDVVATLTVGDFKLVGNADLNLYDPPGAGGREHWWGVSGAPAYAVTNWFGVAARYEYLSDSANAVFAIPSAGDQRTSLHTITGTLDLKPVPNRGVLVLRPELRYEVASDDYFADRNDEPTKHFWTAVLGVVVTSMP